MQRERVWVKGLDPQGCRVGKIQYHDEETDELRARSGSAVKLSSLRYSSPVTDYKHRHYLRIKWPDKVVSWYLRHLISCPQQGPQSIANRLK